MLKAMMTCALVAGCCASVAFAGDVQIHAAGNVNSLSFSLTPVVPSVAGHYCTQGQGGLWYDYEHVNDTKFICSTYEPIAKFNIKPTALDAVNMQILSYISSVSIVRFDITAINGVSSPDSCLHLVDRYDLHHDKGAEVLVSATGCHLQSV